MKNNIRIFLAVWLALALIACASFKYRGAEPEALLPLKTGWYQLDSQRTYKSIEDEFNFFMNTGMRMVSEHTVNHTGVVVRFEDGVLFDPLVGVAGIELLIDSDGRISSAYNFSIRGNLENDGRFFWNGLIQDGGRLHSIIVRGSLTPLPPSARGGPEFDGIFSLTEAGTGLKKIAKISDGFFTWRYLEEETDFPLWPALIQPDGFFSFGLTNTVVMAMGEITSINLSNTIHREGRVIPGQGILMEEISRTTSLGFDQGGAPSAFASTVIHSGELNNEAIPPGIESFVSAARAAARAAPKPNPDQFPSWYLNPPERQGFIFATGEKTFHIKETALALAEAAAAASIAEQLWVRIESSVTEVSTERTTRIDERFLSQTLQRLNFRVIEREFNEETNTAFVLAELEL